MCDFKVRYIRIPAANVLTYTRDGWQPFASWDCAFQNLVLFTQQI